MTVNCEEGKKIEKRKVTYILAYVTISHTLPFLYDLDLDLDLDIFSLRKTFYKVL